MTKNTSAISDNLESSHQISPFLDVLRLFMYTSGKGTTSNKHNVECLPYSATSWMVCTCTSNMSTNLYDMDHFISLFFFYSRMPANGKNLEIRSSWDMCFKGKWNRDKWLRSWYVRLNMPRVTCPNPNVSCCDFLPCGCGYSAYYCLMEASNKLVDESWNLYAHVFGFFVSCCSCTMKIFKLNQWL